MNIGPSTFFWLAIGSVLGGYARFGLTVGINKWASSPFPSGTMLVNVTGCFLIGILATIAEAKNGFSPEAKIFLMTGFCGAYTTFSTFILESVALLKIGAWGQAGLNLGGSVILGLAAYFLGEALVKIF